MVDIADLKKDIAKDMINELYPKGFGCCEKSKSINDFEINWDKNIVTTNETDELFKLRLSKNFGKVYTLNELKEKYDIKSKAFGAILVSPKDEDNLILFNKLSSPQGTDFFYTSDVVMNNLK